MSYSSGAATSISALLSAIEAFAVSEGWTVDSSKQSRSDNATYGECVNISKGAVSGAFYSVLSASAGLNTSFEVPYGYGLGCYTYPSFSSANGNMVQANPSWKTIANNLGSSGYVAHHLFGGPNYLHVAIEVTSGLFKHCGIGQIQKFGAVETGVYNYAVRWNNYYIPIGSVGDPSHAIAFDCYESGSRLGPSLSLRADSDSISPRHCEPNNAAANRVVCGWRTSTPTGGILRLPFGIKPSNLTGRAVLWPFMLSVSRPGGYFSPVGLIPDIRAVRIDNMDPGDTLTIGSDLWRVFPIVRKNGLAGQENSGTYAYAFLQRP